MAAYVIVNPDWHERLEAATVADFVRLVEDIADDARHACPVDTGALMESIGTHFPEPSVGIVSVGTKYWASVEYGSAPHIIESHGDYPLRNRETGQVFGRVVHHPGTPAQPFMRVALLRKRLRP